MNQVTIRVPATTANLGVGFDCIGAALTMANQFQFTVVDTENKLTITTEGDEADKVGTDESNLIYQSFLQLYQKIKQTPPNIKIAIKLGVPLSRGLGSSATAIVGGLLGANHLAGKPLSREEVMAIAIAIEGHPDNVVPALLGNCQLSVADGDIWQISEISWHEDIIPVVAIPNFELSTEEARSVLPDSYNRQDAIFNISRMGLLIRALTTNNREWLKTALADKIHQPYRQQLITGYEQLHRAAISAGAYGMVISGAGPTLLALTDKNNADGVVRSMSEAWSKLGIDATVRSLSLDPVGATML
ncbi:homoserine kinase [Waterburya agarophytonicola K14]|uniref:Homoserine kinase n=1 Tax=Waterburya agarophytonicola KI4 TaxID=2874699 RepID=A0A964BS97_9CYAN|nr:homoserine kinase [Waterburya agarophytonicola]MCC0178803.1 homoserine kinase [Waterburya agarophytonicola KI4]